MAKANEQTGRKAKKPMRPMVRKKVDGRTITFTEFFEDEKNVAKLAKAAECQLTNEQLAGVFDMSRTQFYVVLDRLPHLKNIIDQARSKMIRKVATKAVELALGGDKEMIKLILRTKGNWYEQIEVTNNHTVKHEISLEAIKRVDKMSEDEKAKRLQELSTLDVLNNESNVIDVEILEA